MTTVTISRWQWTAWQAKRLLTAFNAQLSLYQKYLTFLSLAALAVGAGFWVSLWVNPVKYQGQTLGLAEYRLIGPPVELQLMTYNASGLTYSVDTDSLFAIANNPTYIVEMDKLGHELRKITLNGFDDTEGLVFLGDGRFAIVEEDNRSIVIVSIDSETTALTRDQARSVSFPLTYMKNKGFEGVAFNPVDQSLFVVNENQPRALYRIDGAVNPDAVNFSINVPWSMEDNSLNNSDLSGLHFDVRTGHLLVLSDESNALTESTLKGEQVSRLTLSGSKAGFGSRVPQAEGVTMDNNGILYILSEPNLLYRLGPPSAPVAAELPEKTKEVGNIQAKSG